MLDFIDILDHLKNSDVNKVVKSRIHTFNEFRKKSQAEIFEELCFCILTANCTAEKCIEVQKLVGDGVHNLSEEKLAQNLKEFDLVI